MAYSETVLRRAQARLAQAKADHEAESSARVEAIYNQYPRLREIDKLAVVLGTEGDGLAAATIESCDYTVRIPMSHKVDSLNVAAASAVAFWQLQTE